MSPPKTDSLAKARLAWGDKLPAEIEALAREANRTTAAKAAQRIGYSPAVVSHLLKRDYPGDIDRVFAKIRGALLAETVICPIVGEIGTDRCLDEQKMGDTGASSIRSKLYKACRGIGSGPKCPHSRITEAEDADS